MGVHACHGIPKGTGGQPIRVISLPTKWVPEIQLGLSVLDTGTCLPIDLSQQPMGYVFLESLFCASSILSLIKCVTFGSFLVHKFFLLF